MSVSSHQQTGSTTGELAFDAKQGQIFLFFAASRPTLTTRFWKDLVWRIPSRVSATLEDPLHTAISNSQTRRYTSIPDEGIWYNIKNIHYNIFFLRTWKVKNNLAVALDGPKRLSGVCGQ